MRKQSGQLIFSPSDLITFMHSPFASWMEREKLERPEVANEMDPEDAMLASLQTKGFAHEDAFTESLKEAGHDVAEIDRTSPEDMAAKTLKAMKNGREIIAQGALIRDSPDGSSQSPIMGAQWASDVYSALSCHDRPWSALDRADLAMGNPAPSRFRAVMADFDPRRTHLSCRAT